MVAPLRYLSLGVQTAPGELEQAEIRMARDSSSRLVVLSLTEDQLIQVVIAAGKALAVLQRSRERKG